MHGITPPARRHLVAMAALVAAVAAPLSGATRSLQAQAAPLLSVDATSVLGPVDRASSGFLHGDAGDPSRAQALRPQSWRTSFGNGVLDGDYASAREHGAQVTWVLSDDWVQMTGNASPFSNLPRFDDFVRWDVARHEAEAPVDWWDVWNEPTVGGNGSSTADEWLVLFQHAYDDIKSVDPGARVVAPSGGSFDPFFSGAGETAFQTFLTFSSVNNLRWDAISWHDLGACDPGSCGTTAGTPGWGHPDDAARQAQWLRQTIAQKDPALNGVQLQANEYLTLQESVPGWVAGVIGSLDNAGVQGIHSCSFEFDEVSAANPDGGNCQVADLDGLLTPDGTTPRSAWWVYQAYAEMVGQRVATSSADPDNLSAFATLDSPNGEIRVLVGRHQDRCWTPTWSGVCPSGPAPAEQVSLGVTVPWTAGSVSYTVKRLAAPAPEPLGTVIDGSPWPNNNSTTDSPNDLQAQTTGFTTVAAGTAAVSGGVATITLGGTAQDAGVGDGDAYEVYVDAGSGPAADQPVPPMAGSYCPISSCTTTVAGRFTPTGTLGTPMRQSTATLLADGRVLVAGGYFTGYEQWARIYDPATGTWTQAGSMGGARDNHTATRLPDGDVLVAGGQNSGGALPSAEVFDPSTGAWTGTQWMHVPHYGAVAEPLPDGDVLVAGGFTSGTAALTADAEVYHAASGTWTATAPMPQARGGAAAAVLPGGDVLVAGGFTNAWGPAVASAVVYHAASGTWSTLSGAMQTARADATATSLADGRVLLAGGAGTGLSGLFSAPDATATATAEVFDPSTGRFTAAGSLPGGGRVDHVAALLPGGDVLVAGGMDGTDTAHADACLYDPATNSWSATGSMAAARAYATATVLSGGAVLIAGGEQSLPEGLNGFEANLSSAELYTG
jgi:Galactose oxidase, central domain/Kelch motif